MSRAVTRRRSWPEVPADLRHKAEQQLRSPVLDFHTRPGGFTPGLVVKAPSVWTPYACWRQIGVRGSWPNVIVVVVTMMFAEPQIGDAFGRVLRRCWEAGASPGVAFEIIERDDGHIGVGDAARYFDGPDRFSPAERWGCGQVAGRILDVGCGAGRHAVTLMASGHEVVGLDVSPGALSVARERGVRAVRGSVGNVSASIGPFDTIVLLGNNLGLLGRRENARVALEQLAGVTRPTARLIGSGLDPYTTDDPEHHAYHDLNRRRGRMPGHLRIRVRDGRLTTEWFDYVFLSETELVELLDGTPWRLSGVEHDGRNYCVLLDRR